MSDSATYCPEDNKLRLYVGRVPRDEYEKLRAEGWTSTPKQACDFVATWTPDRYETALEYGGGIVEDEDQSPEDRAADRAERFAGYREKRAGEAHGHADRYDAGPAAHGYQSEAKAERAAARHDRMADRAGDAWSRAEYWQHRTAGVISHALYVSTPAVRMGRIKELEADIRRAEKSMEKDAGEGPWLTHFRLRLAYESQMMEAQGGRAAFVEMEPGGWIGGRQIQKVNKSPATGRTVSVALLGTTTGFTRESGYKVQETRPCLVTVTVERLPADAYRPPTDEERAAFTAEKKARKAAAPKKETCPLVNPTDEDAQRLQDVLNERAKEDHCRRHLHSYGKDYAEQFKPSTVCRITQARYSEVSRGAYARAETRGLCADMKMEPRESNMYSAQEERERKERGPAVCMIRTAGADGSDYGARRVIVLTDKPQKALPAAVWKLRQREPSTITSPATVQPALF